MDPNQSPPQPQQSPLATQVNLPNLLDYKQASESIRRLNGLAIAWDVEACANRELRYFTIDVEAQRKAGKLQPDEIYVPQRIINTNIAREQAKFVAYLASPHVALFKDIEEPGRDTQLLELDFTNKFRYDCWQLPQYANVDCFQTHGRSTISVVYDASKPGRFSCEYIPYADFLFATDSKNIQQNEMVAERKYRTKSELIKLADTYGFNQAQVEKVCSSGSEQQMPDQTLFTILLVKFRIDGIVHAAWACPDKADDWLRAPRPFFNGVLDEKKQEVFETDYNYVNFPYSISEDETIANAKGRVFYDEYDQEVITSMMSSLATAHRRASAPYFTRDDDSPGATGELQTQQIVPGAIIDKKLKTFQMLAPDSSMLSAIQALATANSANALQINFATNNRKDSRKTAKEVGAAQEETNLLSTVQVSLYSIGLSQVIEFCTRIYFSQVIAKQIPPYCPIEVYSRKYTIIPAGDIEVVRRQQLISQMIQIYPIVAQTPIAMAFLQRLIGLMFPEDAPMYTKIMAQEDQKTKLLISLAGIIQSLIIDPKTGQLTQEAQPHAQELKQILLQVQQMTQSAQASSGGQPQQSQSSEQQNTINNANPQQQATA